jgi:hypothetical protein
MDFAVVLEYDDFVNAEVHRSKENGDASTTTLTSITVTKRPYSVDDIENISDDEDFGSMERTDLEVLGTKRATST